MKVRVKHLKALLNELITFTGGSLSKKGLKIIQDRIGGLGEDYLYNKILLKIRNKGDDDFISYHDAPMEHIVRFLNYKDFEAFIDAVDNPIASQLKKCLGTYYSFVRRSMGDGTLFRSPVRIFEKESKVWMELKGKRLKYFGPVKLKRDCLFVPLESEEGKGFYHIYKIGTSEGPEVLQGMFSGVSNTFEPIAGRAVLLRMNNDFQTLKNDEQQIAKLKKSKSLDERRLAEYFEKHSENNLVLKRVYFFDNRDLGTCR